MTIKNPPPLPGPVEGAPYTTRSLTLLRLACAAAEAADFAIGEVPTGPPPRLSHQPGLYLEDALTLVARAREVLDAVVLVELDRGTSWEDIAEIVTAYTREELSAAAAEARWAPLEKDWNDQLARAATPGRTSNIGLSEELADPDACIARLDDWVTRHADDSPRGDGQLVSQRMQRMDAFGELGHQGAQRNRLRAEHLAPPASLLIPIYEREAVLYDAMVAAGFPGYADGAQRCRDRAAKLRAGGDATTDATVLEF
jgi:hypothetical protein